MNILEERAKRSYKQQQQQRRSKVYARRYRFHGKPASLEEVRRAFLGRIPTDEMDYKELRGRH